MVCALETFPTPVHSCFTVPSGLWFARSVLACTCQSVAHLLTLLFSGVWTELGSRGASGAKVIEAEPIDTKMEPHMGMGQNLEPQHAGPSR